MYSETMTEIENNPHQTLIEEKVDSVRNQTNEFFYALTFEQRTEINQWLFETLQDTIDTVSMMVREEEAVEYNKIIERAVADERQFILNILDGIDIADEEMGNNGGGTKSNQVCFKE